METYRSFEIKGYAGELEVEKGDAPWTDLPVRLDMRMDDVGKSDTLKIDVFAIVPGRGVIGFASYNKTPDSPEKIAEELVSAMVQDYRERSTFALYPLEIDKLKSESLEPMKDGIAELMEG